MAWYFNWLGETHLSLGVTPFIFAEIFKILLLSLLVKKLIKFKNFI